MANLKYNSFKANLAKGLINLEDNTKVKVLLVTTAYVGSANIDTDTMTQVNAGEISAGGNYSTGGVLLTNPAVTQDNTNDLAKFDADNVTWASSTITAGGAVIWYDDTTDYPICLIDFAGDKSSSNGDFTIQWDANGILTIS